MSKSGKIKIVLGLALLVAVVLGAFLPVFTRASNCGGNSAAISVCRDCVLSIQITADDQGGRFNIGAFSESEKAELARNGQNSWISDAHFFIRTNIALDTTNKSILVVCDYPYDNIPQPTFWNGYRKNPAHAVGYSDGSVGLIAPAQFKAMDLSGFIDAAQLQINASPLTNGVQRL